MALISMLFKKIYKPTNNNLRTSLNTRNANVDNTPRTNRGTGYDRQTEQYDNQREINVARARETVGTQVVQPRESAYHKEKMLLCKQKEAGIQLSAEQVDWRDDTDDEPEDQELEAHYIKHPEQPESINNTYLVKQGDTNITHDSLDMSNNGEEADQDDDLAKERDLLASLIEKLKYENDDNKNRKKLLESSNKTLIEKLKLIIEQRVKDNQKEMDEPDITMAEYVQLETERAPRNGKVYNWETTTYGKIGYDEDVHYLRYFEIKFPAIIYNDALASKLGFSSEPSVSPQHVDKISLKIETSLSEYD
ncbi:hypothetical protein Tco_0303659 [Tanacetum coccineum]